MTRFGSPADSSAAASDGRLRREQLVNGMPAGALPAPAWVKSTRSGAQANCVETAVLPEALVAVRNSRDGSGPALVFTRSEMAAFLLGVKDGEFDHLLADQLP